MPTTNGSRVSFDPVLLVERQIAAGRAAGESVAFTMSLSPMADFVRRHAARTGMTRVQARTHVEVTLTQHARDLARPGEDREFERTNQRAPMPGVADGKMLALKDVDPRRMSVMELAHQIAKARHISFSEATLIADDLRRDVAGVRR
jgi:hypothetical protein